MRDFQSRSVKSILTDLGHAGFPKMILVKDRGYESLSNLDIAIESQQAALQAIKDEREPHQT
jgi:hypothetical protein